MPKKGLSLEEKRTALRDMLLEDETVYQLKDIEKTAQKRKGVTGQSVKEVITSLVDDGFIESERLGPSLYYWLFRSEAGNARKRRFEQLNADIDSTTAQIKLVEKKIKTLKGDRKESDTRTANLAKLAETQAQRDTLASKITELQGLDPEYYEALQADAKVGKDAANRWTDNLFNLTSYCSSTFGMDSDSISKGYNIPADIDYI